MTGRRSRPAGILALARPTESLLEKIRCGSFQLPRMFRLLTSAFLLALCAEPNWAAEPAIDMSDVGLPPAGYKLIQEIDCSQENSDILFLEYPAGVSKVETVLGVPCRVLSNTEGDAKYFAYRIGEGKGLKAGGCYVVSVEYPEDRSRTMYLCNWGCETALGFATGESLGDVLQGQVRAQQSRVAQVSAVRASSEQWTQLFYLHDRFPEIKRPRGLGAAAADAGRRFLVHRGAAGGVSGSAGCRGGGVEDPALRSDESRGADAARFRFRPRACRGGTSSRARRWPTAWSPPGTSPRRKTRPCAASRTSPRGTSTRCGIMEFLGIDTYGKDLLEFGHNQGWDSSEGGGNDWVYQAPTPGLWAEILERAAKHDLTVLPYYEYRGSIGGNKSLALGPQHRCQRLDGGDTYTHISWCEGNNADITDPDTLADAKKILDMSLVKYKDKVKFLGAWFRQRPTAMPISFNEQEPAGFRAGGQPGPAHHTVAPAGRQAIARSILPVVVREAAAVLRSPARSSAREARPRGHRAVHQRRQRAGPATAAVDHRRRQEGRLAVDAGRGEPGHADLGEDPLRRVQVPVGQAVRFRRSGGQRHAPARAADLRRELGQVGDGPRHAARRSAELPRRRRRDAQLHLQPALHGLVAAAVGRLPHQVGPGDHAALFAQRKRDDRRQRRHPRVLRLRRGAGRAVLDDGRGPAPWPMAIRSTSAR